MKDALFLQTFGGGVGVWVLWGGGGQGVWGGGGGGGVGGGGGGGAQSVTGKKGLTELQIEL